MAIRAGQIIHYGNSYLIDRIQTGGPGDLTITRNKIYETGNYQSVGITQEPPTLSFNLEALDVSSDIELMLTGTDPLVAAAGQTVDFTIGSFYMDVVSPWKSPYGQFASIHGAAIPYLGLESVSYRYGVTDNAGETFTLQGDSIFYAEGRPVIQREAILTGGSVITAGTAIPFKAQPGPWTAQNTGGTAVAAAAMPYNDQGVSKYALSVCKISGATITAGPIVKGGVWTRLTYGTDYAETSAGITLTADFKPGEALSIVYATLDPAIIGTLAVPSLDFPQTIHHPPGTAKGAPAYPRPAAIRGRDIELYIAPSGANFTPVHKWPEVQNLTIDWRITVEADYELGNSLPYDRSPTDVPAVSGNVELRAKDIASLFKRMQQITGVPVNQVIGPQSAALTDMLIVLRNPATGGVGTITDTGRVIKTLLVPSVRFTLPGYSAAANQKMNSTLNFDSDLGALFVGKGVMTETGGAPAGTDGRLAGLSLTPVSPMMALRETSSEEEAEAQDKEALETSRAAYKENGVTETPSYIKTVSSSK